MVYNTDYERYQMRTNLDINIKPWISVGTNLFGYYDTNNPSAENAAAGVMSFSVTVRSIPCPA